MGIGYGKGILFGDHFVVYGLPAIAASVDRKTEIWIRELEGKGILCDYEGRWKGKNLLEDDEETDWFKTILFVLLKELDLKGKNFYMRIENNIPVGSGMGSSAAISVALVRALNEFFELGLSDGRVSELAYKAEEVFHGTPSGIDNSIATFGGLIWFEKDKGIERLQVREPINIVIARVERQGNTKMLVEGVRKRKEDEPEKFEEIFKKEKELVEKARNALLAYDLNEVGKLMNENQKLLEEIGVSTKELEELCKTALENGALGAKLTGAGGGGCMIALTPGKEKQERVANALREKSLEVIKTKIGV